MMSKRVYTVAWATWAAVGLGIEVVALRDKRKGDTLSEHVWALTKQPVLWWQAAGLLTWATLHFLGRGRFG